MSNIRQVYTASGFDSTQAGAGTDTQDHELDAVASAVDSNYAVVKITGTSSVSGDSSSGSGGNVQLKAQIKETGGGYGDIIAFKSVLSKNDQIQSAVMSASYTYEIVATLTAGQKTNGFQIKVFSSSVGSSTNGTSSFVNIQTIQELRT